MTTEIRFRRGTAAQHAAFTGAAGEVTVNTTDNSLVVHNGTTPGGFQVPILSGGSLPVAKGGTGATTADGARTALSVYSVAQVDSAIASSSSPQLQSIDYTLSGGALTLKLNPTGLDFRSSTLTTGAPTRVAFPAQVTATLSSGSTCGVVSGVQSDILVLALSTGDIGLVNAAGGLVLDEQGVINTVAEGGAGGADSATTVYSTVARTGVAYRVVGLFRSTQTTAGTWTQTPTLVQGIGGLALIPRRLLQVVTYQTGSLGAGTATIPGDNSVPQSGEGDQYLAATITPQRPTSTLEITVLAVLSNNANVNQTVALFRDASASAIAANFGFIAATAVLPIGLTHTLTAGSTETTTFKVRSGGSSAGLTTLNGIGGAAYLGGVMSSHITIKEYAA